jgi:probable HAF family extracellular repeat protein
MLIRGERFLQFTVLAFLLFGCPVLAQSAYGPRLYVDIHPLGWLSSTAVCVNAAGHAVGNGVTSQGERGFRWAAGRYEMVLPDGAAASRVAWVNDRGDIAGTAFDAEGTPHAFLFRDGRYLDPTPGWRFSEALFVDRDGLVTGTGEHGGFVSGNGVVSTPSSFTSIVGRTPTGVLFGNADNVARMYIPEKGYLTLVPPGGDAVSPGRMNDKGLATFSASERGVEKGYVFSGGFMIFMTPPGWTSSVAASINSLGEVAGYGDGPDGRKGFLRSGLDYEVISCPEFAAMEANSVNDFGEVAGSGVTASGETHAFFSYPVSASAPANGSTGVETTSAGGGCSAVPSAAGQAPADAVANVLLFLFPVGLPLARRVVRRRFNHG